MTHPGLQIVGVYDVEPHVIGGVQYGRHLVVAQFPKIKRPSRGWRKHVRLLKAARRRA